MSHTAKYDRLAAGFTDNEYADPAGYAARWAKVICDCSPGLRPGARLLDLGCGDGLMAAGDLARGLAYTGVDASPTDGRGGAGSATRASLPRWRGSRSSSPPQPVETTICLRAFFYAEDRAAFFRRVAGYTRGTFVFDFRRPALPRPRAEHPRRPAGGRVRYSVELRPFFLPPAAAGSPAAKPLLYAVEQSGPPARLLTRRVGRFVCVASGAPRVSPWPGRGTKVKPIWAPSERASRASGGIGLKIQIATRTGRRGDGERRASSSVLLWMQGVDAGRRRGRGGDVLAR